MRKLILTLVVLAASLAIGCDDVGAPATGQSATAIEHAENPRVAFVGAGEGDPIWPILETGARRYIEAMESLDVQFVNPRGRSPQDQIDALRGLDLGRLQALCIYPIDQEGIQTILDDVYTRGIVIVSVIRQVPDNLRAAHVGYDNRAVGEALAASAIEALDGEGSLAVIHGSEDDPISRRRRLGFEQELRTHPDIVVFASHDCKGRPLEARTIIEEYSERFPRLSAWVSLDDWPLRERGPQPLPLPPGCPLITFGGTPDQWPLIERGVLAGIVAPNYGELGAEALRQCETALRQRSRFSRRHDVPLRTIWRGNLDQYRDDWHYWSTGEFPKPRLEE